MGQKSWFNVNVDIILMFFSFGGGGPLLTRFPAYE